MPSYNDLDIDLPDVDADYDEDNVELFQEPAPQSGYLLSLSQTESVLSYEMKGKLSSIHNFSNSSEAMSRKSSSA